MKVSFIGLGIMGSRMASNLLKNKVELTVYNRSPEPIEKLVNSGASAAQNVAEAVADADIVFSMLSTPQVVEEYFFGSKGALSKMKDGAIWVDCTTVNPSFSIKSSEEAKDYKINFIDAPVAGSKPQAEGAELVFFVGSEVEHLSFIQSLLNMMGKKVVHVGEVGKGTSFKMLINLMLAQSMVIFSESILLGKSMGLSEDFLLGVLPTLPVTAPFTNFKVDAIKEDNYDVQFPLEWMLKDLDLACKTAEENNYQLNLATLTKELYNEANEVGLGRLDFSAIHRFLSNSSTSEGVVFI